MGKGEETPFDIPEELQSVLSGVIESLGTNTDLAGLTDVLSKTDISPLLGLLKNINAPDSGPAAQEESTDRATALLKALRPFMNSSRSNQVDRAIDMLGTARTVRAALKAFGSMTEGKLI